MMITGLVRCSSLLFCLLSVLLFTAPALAGFAVSLPSASITLDGSLDDWRAAGVSPFREDPAGDNEGGLADIRYFYLAVDDDYLYWAIETASDHADQYDEVYLRMYDAVWGHAHWCDYIFSLWAGEGWTNFWLEHDTVSVDLGDNARGDHCSLGEAAEGRIPLSMLNYSDFGTI